MEQILGYHGGSTWCGACAATSNIHVPGVFNLLIGLDWVGVEWSGVGWGGLGWVLWNPSGADLLGMNIIGPDRARLGLDLIRAEWVGGVCHGSGRAGSV